MATIFLWLVGCPALAKRSFLQMDLFARSAEARRWVASRRRRVLSDCPLSASVLLIPGDPQNLLDLEPWPGPGQELACREAVLRRAFGRHGARWGDLVLADGLYRNEPMLGLCRDELKTHLSAQFQGKGTGSGF